MKGILFTMIIKSLQLSFVTLLVSAVAAWAASPTGPARIQGVVKDSRGAAVAGAEVHIKSKDGSGLEKIVRTDAGGNYGVSNLPLTDYEVVLFVGGQIKASINNTKAMQRKADPTRFQIDRPIHCEQHAQEAHAHGLHPIRDWQQPQRSLGRSR